MQPRKITALPSDMQYLDHLRADSCQHLKLLSVSKIYVEEVEKAFDDRDSVCMLLLNPTHLGIISTGNLTWEELDAVEPMVTSTCHYTSIERWKILLSTFPTQMVS